MKVLSLAMLANGVGTAYSIIEAMDGFNKQECIDMCRERQRKHQMMASVLLYSGIISTQIDSGIFKEGYDIGSKFKGAIRTDSLFGKEVLEFWRQENLQCMHNCNRLAAKETELAACQASSSNGQSSCQAKYKVPSYDYKEVCDSNVKECIDWSCETWCKCYNPAHDEVYDILGCGSEGGDTCECE